MQKHYGKLLRISAGRFEGYAYDPEHPYLHIEILLYINNALCAQTLATHQHKNIGNGHNGFSLTAPDNYYNGNEYLMDLRVNIDGVEKSLLSNPLNIRLNAPAPAAIKTPAPPQLLYGAIDMVQHGVVAGWCFNPAALSDDINVECLIDGLKVATGKAEHYRADLTNLSINAEHGFRIVIPENLLDDAPHSISIVASSEIAETWQMQLESVLSAPNNPYEGRIDLAEYPKIQGWAWNMRNQSEIVELEIWLNGELLDKISASEMRDDLLKAGVADGRKAFNYQINKPLDFSKDYSFEVKVASNQIPLKNSPIKLTFPKALVDYRTHISKLNSQGAFEAAPDIDISSSIWQLHAIEQAPKISLIIPIYNAYEELQNCLDSVLKHSQIAKRIILMNDASPDPRIKPYLNRLKALDNRLQVIHNKTNLGYTKNINKAIMQAGDDDIVLLNSDTIVTENWLQQMQRTAYIASDIGTVTAISDNAGAFSVPELESNLKPESFSHDELGRLIRQNSPHLTPSTPTANGFCCFIKRALINHIGLFDDTNFPRGYGEENDFSMRASAKGWQHKVDDSCLIFHVRSASFGDEKIALMEKSKAKLSEIYPEYSKLAADFCTSPAMQNLRKTIRDAYSVNSKPKPRILYVIHGNATGGTPQTNRDLMQQMQDKYEIFLLECDRELVSLSKWVDDQLYNEAVWQLQQPINFTALFRRDYAAIIWHILRQYAIDLIHIRHLYKHSFDLPRLAKALHIPTILSLHDFYFVCPTINLLDERQQFCAGKCTKNLDEQADCQLPYHLEEKLPPLKHQYVYRFRAEVERMLAHIDNFVTTSDFAKQLICETYPTLKSSDFHVIEHGRDFNSQHNFSKTPTSDAPLKILIAAQLAKHKGADFIQKLLELDAGKNELEFHFLGNLPKQYQHLGEFHGSYQRETLPERIAQLDCHVMGIFSIWAETYCHVLSESWACGMPVIASNIGALKERIETHDGGWLVDTNDATKSYQQIISIKHNQTDYQLKAAKSNLTAVRSIQAMTDDYEKLYTALRQKY
jgi:GT2 family glycosyltransferase/glycosyltransferase involved in cell wall biosynthesis